MEKFKVSDAAAAFSLKHAQLLVPIPINQTDMHLEFIDVFRLKDEVE